MNLQQAEAAWHEINARIACLEPKERAFFDKIKSVNAGRYDVDSMTVITLCSIYSNNAIEAFNTIFQLGFMQGQKAEKAEEKKRGRNNERNYDD